MGSEMCIRDRCRTPYLGFHHQKLNDYPVLSIEECETALYLRFNAIDKPGVLSQITEIFSEASISVEAMVQKDRPAQHTEVPIVVLTSVAKQSDFDSLVSKLEQLDVVVGSVTHIRVDRLES